MVGHYCAAAAVHQEMSCGDAQPDLVGRLGGSRNAYEATFADQDVVGERMVAASGDVVVSLENRPSASGKAASATLRPPLDHHRRSALNQCRKAGL